jgi:hypothetical protein
MSRVEIPRREILRGYRSVRFNFGSELILGSNRDRYVKEGSGDHDLLFRHILHRLPLLLWLQGLCCCLSGSTTNAWLVEIGISCWRLVWWR